MRDLTTGWEDIATEYQTRCNHQTRQISDLQSSTLELEAEVERLKGIVECDPLLNYDAWAQGEIERLTTANATLRGLLKKAQDIIGWSIDHDAVMDKWTRGRMAAWLETCELAAAVGEGK